MSSHILTWPRTLGAIPLLLLPLLALGCSGSSTEPEGAPPLIESLPRPLTSQETLLARAGNDFAFNLLKQVAAAERGNLFLSPVSASMALGMAASGAEGETFAQMREMLGFGSLSREEMGAGYRGLLELLRGLDPRVEFEVANSVWLREGFPVKPAWLSFVASSFDATARTLDFNSPSAPTTINAWVAERTRNRIPTIVEPPIDPATMAFLINAIYFKGDWRDGFDPAATRNGPFAGVSGTSSVPLMRQEGEFAYTAAEDHQVVELPYGGAAFAMTLVLPQPGMDPGAFAERLDPAWWRSTTERLRTAEGTVVLPRFRMEYKRSLVADLRALGMTDAFDDVRADFSGIAEVPPRLVISDVLQKTFVAVDEVGTEAAAVTSVEVGVTSAPARFLFQADRPFLFVLRERLSGTVLFVGLIREAPIG